MPDIIGPSSPGNIEIPEGKTKVLEEEGTSGTEEFSLVNQLGTLIEKKEVSQEEQLEYIVSKIVEDNPDASVDEILTQVAKVSFTSLSTLSEIKTVLQPIFHVFAGSASVAAAGAGIGMVGGALNAKALWDDAATLTKIENEITEIKGRLENEGLSGLTKEILEFRLKSLEKKIAATKTNTLNHSISFIGSSLGTGGTIAGIAGATAVAPPLGIASAVTGLSALAVGTAYAHYKNREVRTAKNKVEKIESEVTKNFELLVKEKKKIQTLYQEQKKIEKNLQYTNIDKTPVNTLSRLSSRNIKIVKETGKAKAESHKLATYIVQSQGRVAAAKNQLRRAELEMQMPEDSVKEFSHFRDILPAQLEDLEATKTIQSELLGDSENKDLLTSLTDEKADAGKRTHEIIEYIISLPK